MEHWGEFGKSLLGTEFVFVIVEGGDSSPPCLCLHQSVSFSMGPPPAAVVTSYLDTFPFPYYILLRDIEALPRTLANLLRQVSSGGV